MPHRTHRRPSPPPARNRKHSHDPGYLDPVLTRRQSASSHPGRIVFAVAGLLFAAYIFNWGGTETYLDGFFRTLEHSAHLHDAEVGKDFMLALPYLGILLACFVALIVFSAMRRGARTLRKVRRLSDREELTLHSFAEMAAGHGIGQRVSREAYHLLLPLYRNRMRARGTDCLTRDLRLTPLEIGDLYGNLMRMTDRQRSVREDPGKIHTILDLMLAVERSEIRSVTESGAHRRGEKPLIATRAVETLRHRSLIRPAHLPRAKPASPTVDKPAQSTGTDGPA